MDADQIATPDEDTLDSSPEHVVEVEESSEPLNRRDAIAKAYKEAAKADTPAVEAKATEPAKEEAAPAEPEASTEANAEKPIDPPPSPDNLAKAPRMWSAATREKFAALPEDVRAEIIRREREIDTKLTQTSQERQVAAAFMSVADPHLDFFKQIGKTPFAAAQEAFQMGRVLTTGTEQQKAQLVAQLARQYKIDFNELDLALAGSTAAPAVDPILQQRLAQLEQQVQASTQTTYAEQTRSLNSHIDAFVNDPKNEFVREVWQDMVAVLNANPNADLATAYAKAVKMNDEVQNVLKQRSQTTASRVAASASLKGSTTPRAASSANSAPKDRRAALEAAWDDLAE